MTHPAKFTLDYPPPGWHYIQAWGDGHCFVHKNGLRVVIDCERRATI